MTSQWTKRMLAALVVMGSIALFAESPGLESLPQRQCDYPRDLTGVVPLATGGDMGSSIAWDGAAFGMAWVDGYDVRFARVAADGTILAGPTTTFTGDSGNRAMQPVIVPNGTGYGVSWATNGGVYHIRFASLDLSGNLVGTISQVDNLPGGTSANDPSLSWNGLGYGVSWDDTRDGAQHIYFALLDSSGQNTSGDIRVSTRSSFQTKSSLVWTGAGYGIAWQDNDAPAYEIYFARLSSSGTPLGSGTPVSAASGDKYGPSLVWTGVEYGLTWSSYNTGAWGHIYFCRIDSTGNVISGSESNLTPTTEYNYSPSLAWTGAEYGLRWTVEVSYRSFFTRIGPYGGSLGTPLSIASPALRAIGQPRGLAYGTLGYGLAVALNADTMAFVGLGCHYDSTQPPCPGDIRETARTKPPATQTVTLGWLKSADYESEIAYYDIYRNGVWRGRTTDATWTDGSFSAAAGYVYDVVAINVPGMQSSGCSSVDTGDRVPPTCPSNLLATSVTSSAVTLAWLPSTDAKSGLQSYLVYRNNQPWTTVPNSQTGYTDSLVSPNTTYNYAVSAFDFAGNEQAACQSLWVSTRPITLYLTKNADTVNADLDWNDVELNEYVVYRSASPQTALELKRVPVNQTTDAVLKDGVKLWFYFIQQREP